MKKGLLAILMAVVMAVPAFAAKGDMSVNAKLGLGVSNSVKMSNVAEMPSDLGMGIKAKTPFSLGAEFFYGTSDMLSVGFGVNYVFDTEAKYKMEGMTLKGGTTNLYVAVKPEFKVESNIFSSVYLIGQFGLSMGRAEAEGAPSVSVDSGIYLGAGFGTIIKDAVLVELVFSSCNGSMDEGEVSVDLQYTITSINVGYKFNI